MENNEKNFNTESETLEIEDIKKGQDKTSGIIDVAVDLLEDLQAAISGGKPKMLKVKLGEKTVAELPLALTAVAAVAAGLAAVILTKLSVEIERED